MDATDRSKKRANTPGQPETNTPPRERTDPYATPLGRGADPGPVDAGAPGASGVAGLHGAGTPGERGGPSGFVDRENEDTKHEVREAPQGTTSSANDADA